VGVSGFSAARCICVSSHSGSIHDQAALVQQSQINDRDLGRSQMTAAINFETSPSSELEAGFPPKPPALLLLVAILAMKRTSSVGVFSFRARRRSECSDVTLVPAGSREGRMGVKMEGESVWGCQIS
jgi:hypothetical protein